MTWHHYEQLTQKKMKTNKQIYIMSALAAIAFGTGINPAVGLGVFLILVLVLIK